MMYIRCVTIFGNVYALVGKRLLPPIGGVALSDAESISGVQSAWKQRA